MTKPGLLRWGSASLLALVLLGAPQASRAQPEDVAEPLPEQPVEATGAAGEDESGDEPAEGETQPTEGDERDQGTAGQSDAAAAHSLHQLGEALMRMGDLEEACPKLEQSLAAEVSAETALLLALCHDKQGKLASAWAGYRQAAVMLRAAGRPADARQASERALDLAPKVPKLTIVPAQQVPGMEIWRDGVKFGAGVFGVPVAINPGEHSVEIRAAGYESWATELTIGSNGDRPMVAVPPLRSLSTGPPSLRASDRAGPSWMFTTGVISAGAGAASIGLGTILGLVAARDIHTAESDETLCGADRQCSDEGYGLVERADREALGSTIAIAAGSVAVVTGFVLVVLDTGLGTEEGDPEPGLQARLTPMVGPTLNGLSLSIKF
jgi:hypothetical protein